jgi:hypothetical protein
MSSKAGDGDKPARKKHGPFREPDPHQKVGPGNTPVEYRWPKGYCPNRAGRPPKKIQEANIPQGVNPLQRLALEHAHKFVGEFNGELITRYERLLAGLELRAHEDAAIAKLLVGTYAAAERETAENGFKALAWALNYKEKWGPVFERAQAAGRPPPPTYPHPDDLIITRNYSVEIDGPFTAEGAKILAVQIEIRDRLFSVALDAMKPGVENGREIYEYLRRKYYRFHRNIPKRLYQKFPTFKAPPMEDGGRC